MTATKRAMLVYQCGLANVFGIDPLNKYTLSEPAGRVRLTQGDFRSCEAFARGMEACGYQITSVHCNMAGDIACAKWDSYLSEAPFRENMRPVGSFIHPIQSRKAKR